MVTDITRAPLAGVSVQLLHEETNDRRQVSTDEDGQFAISALPPGSYLLEIEHPSYKQYVQTIPLQVNQERRVDPILEVGALTEEVFVVAPAVPLERVSPAIGTVIENRQVTGLPLDGRNFLELSLLAPGVAPAAPGSAGSVRGDFGFHANGGREDANSYVLDGVYNVDPKLNAIGVSPPVDAVQEFKILTSTYDASFGRNAGGQVNVVLQAGTNTLKGAAYEFLRSGALDARNFFAPRDEDAPEYQRNQFGFSAGGPISKNRSFFFADYEGRRIREGITRVTNVPTRAERAGDFSQSLFRRPINPFTQQPFADGRIPSFFIDPIGQALAALYPEPNRSVPFQNFVSSPLRRDRVDQFDVRLDQALGTSSDLTIRYSFADRDLFEPFSGTGFSAVPGFGTNVPRRAQNLAISERRILSPSLLNEIRFGYGRVASAVWQENRGRSLNRQVGLPELSSNSRDFGLSFITASGFSPLGDEYNNPQE
ncbi:MAG: beta-sandwich domain-containing protein, partial [Acidimicrobiia bacterium]